MAGPYIVGNVVRMKANWTDPNSNPPNAPIDPTTITFRYADPTGVVTSFVFPASVVKEAVGAYHLDVVCNIAGDWWYDAFSTGVAQARAESKFTVLASRVP
jgi:hypothetical protein